MGLDTIPDRTNGQTIIQSFFNLLKSVLKGDFVPRNTSGVVTSLEGCLGTTTYNWLKAYIASGYFSCGDVKWMHSFNGVISLPQGWMICNGSLCNEAQYNSQHSAGDWDTYVISSPLDGLYMPNLINRYAVGIAATTEDGSSSITPVGLDNHEVDLQHNHSHKHQIYDNTNATSDDNMYNSSGNPVTIPTGTDKSATVNHLEVRDGGATTVGYSPLGDVYSSIDATNGLANSTSVQPRSIELIPLIRIIT